MARSEWHKCFEYFRFAADLVRLPFLDCGIGRVRARKKPYQYSFPRASYAPWLSDKKFLEVFNTIRSHTLVDVYRCWELWHLVQQAVKVQGDIIEIGVWRGGTGTLIASRLMNLDSTRRMYLCDTFSGIVKAGRSDNLYSGGEHKDTTVEMVESLSEKLRLANVQVLKGVFPEETGKVVENRTFCFCHIDVDVHDSARSVFDWVWTRLENGGIVVFDDYGSPFCKGITKFVNDILLKDQCIVFHNLNGHAVLIKRVSGHFS